MPVEVKYIEHTADVGIEVRAPDLEGIFSGAAAGLSGLLLGEDVGAERAAAASGPVETVPVRCTAADVPGLLVAWLRELVFLLSTRSARVSGVGFERLSADRLEARVELAGAAAPVREIKGVTYHGLRAEPVADGWAARVIFDV